MEMGEKRNAKISDGEGIEKRRKLEIVGLEDRFYLLLIFSPQEPDYGPALLEFSVLYVPMCP